MNAEDYVDAEAVWKSAKTMAAGKIDVIGWEIVEKVEDAARTPEQLQEQIDNLIELVATKMLELENLK